MIRRINLFGGPGSTKSTVAAGVYANLRTKGVDIELIQEYIKTWAYEDKKCISFDQLYVFSKQLHAEDILLRSGVKFIINDSPTLMQLAYVQEYGKVPLFEELQRIEALFEKTYPSLSIWLERGDIPYDRSGRYETYEAALHMDEVIKSVLEGVGRRYYTVGGSGESRIAQTCSEIEKHIEL